MNISGSFNAEILKSMAACKDCEDLYHDLLLNHLGDTAEGSIDHNLKQLFKMSKPFKEQFVDIFKSLVLSYDKSTAAVGFSNSSSGKRN